MAPDLGIAWIAESLPGYRRIVDPQEFSIWLRRQPGSIPLPDMPGPARPAENEGAIP